MAVSEEHRRGFYDAAGKGKQLPKDGGKHQPGDKDSPKTQMREGRDADMSRVRDHKKPSNNRSVRGENNIQKAVNHARERHMPEGQDGNDYRPRGLQTNSYNNRLDPAVLEEQRRMRENRRIQLKHAKDKLGVKTRLESAKQDKIKEGFAIGASKVDRVSGMQVINPALRNTVPAKEMAKQKRG